MNTPNFTVWKTIRLGGLAISDIGRAIRLQKELHIGWCGGDILPGPDFSLIEVETQVDLVKISVRSLGFECPTVLENLLVKASEMGLSTCPAEVGPQLFLQYADQPKEERLYIGMNPIRRVPDADDNDSYHIFGVEHREDETERYYGRWLAGCNCRGVRRTCIGWHPDDVFVFVLPRK